METFKVFRLGVREWRDVVEQGVGMSYEDSKLNEVYDTGVNFGENMATVAEYMLTLGTIVRHVAAILRHPLTQNS